MDLERVQRKEGYREARRGVVVWMESYMTNAKKEKRSRALLCHFGGVEMREEEKKETEDEHRDGGGIISANNPQRWV